MQLQQATPSCTSYCNCSGEDDCCNLHSARQNAQGGEGESIEEEDLKEDIMMEDADEKDFEETAEMGDFVIEDF